jgi:hypothetical protein
VKLALLILFILPALILGCIEIERKVAVTPGEVPAEIRAASWSERPIPYCVVLDQEGGFVNHQTLVRLTQEAFEAWGVPTVFEGRCSGGQEQEDNVNEIGFGDLDQTPNVLVEADIVIEREAPKNKDGEDCLFTTLLHETGHFLGLPHMDADTIMSPVIMECLQEPTAKDRAVLDELY